MVCKYVALIIIDIQPTSESGLPPPPSILTFRRVQEPRPGVRGPPLYSPFGGCRSRGPGSGVPLYTHLSAGAGAEARGPGFPSILTFRRVQEPRPGVRGPPPFSPFGVCRSRGPGSGIPLYTHLSAGGCWARGLACSSGRPGYTAPQHRFPRTFPWFPVCCIRLSFRLRHHNRAQCEIYVRRLK